MSATKLVQPKTKRGRRILEARAPKLIEDTRRALIVNGSKTNQAVKDVLAHLHKLKGTESLRLSRKNDIHPFEPGAGVWIEHQGQKSNCSLFAIGMHSKKRPNNLVMGRLYDFHIFDMVEFGIKGFAPISSFHGAQNAQLGNKPAFVFAGDSFEVDPELVRVKSLFLDFFRGRQVNNLNLKGLDRVIYVTHDPLNKTILFRQFSIRYKKSGTRIPRVELTPMGPSLDLEVRRMMAPTVDVEKEAMKQPKLRRTKEKNVRSEVLDGKVGRIYMPPQNVDTMALHKSKGLKRRKGETEGTTGASRKSAKTV